MIQGVLHGPSGASTAWAGQRDVVPVRRHPVADHLGVDVGAAGQGVLALLEDERRRALGHHETVAIGVERTARPLRVVVVE